MQAELIIIGNEITQGFTLDTNSVFLGRELGGLGVIVSRKTAVGDDKRDIVGAVRAAMKRTDLVICTGGLGPTCDDVTKKAVARMFGSRLVLNRDVLQHIESRFALRGISMPAVNRGQAMVPDKASVLHNTQGTAPGLLFTKGRKRVALLPGVPHEMRAIWRESLRTLISELTGRRAVACLTLRTFGLPESALCQKLEPVEALLTPGELAYQPGAGGVDLRLTFSGKNRRMLAAKLHDVADRIVRILGQAVFGRDEETLASVVGALLKEKNCTVTLAESCTGGLVSDRLTDVPGSSDYFIGSVVAYSNALKIRLLGVSGETLRSHGAVSTATAREMARGAQKRLGSDIGLGVTGIAGPSGGTSEKPVGLACFGITGPKGTVVEERRFLGTRRIIKELSANTALNLLRLYLLK
ncbi:MAG: competence/damage-inducible protein A [Candidatus Edwardsbacteria bacterium]|nr:competence/damage-inducible protein A [Candidatus Edwardsbacteria bacterium]